MAGRRFTGLWRNGDFLRLWSGQTISVFGSLIGRPAISFAAILTLHATPFQMGLLAVATQAPGFVVGLPAGVWVDRVRRRPLMIGADLGRAALLATIPLAAWRGWLSLGQLYVVAFLAGVLTIFFDVSYQSFVPAIVRREELVDANSKLQGTESIAEVGGFGLAGIVVQVLSAPAAILMDAISFVCSALFIGSIRRREPEPAPAEEREGMRQELREGVREILHNPILRALAGSSLTVYVAFGMVGSLIVLFCNRVLGIAPAPLGIIWCVGGVSSLAGAATAGRVTRRLGLGPTMTVMILLFGVFELFIPLAGGAVLLAGTFLVLQQLLGDYVEEIYSINHVSLRQAITPERLIGRVSAATRFMEASAQLAGALLGGVLGQVVGMRPTLVFASGIMCASALWFVLSPIRRLRDVAPAGGEPGIVRAELP